MIKNITQTAVIQFNVSSEKFLPYKESFSIMSLYRQFPFETS